MLYSTKLSNQNVKPYALAWRNQLVSEIICKMHYKTRHGYERSYIDMSLFRHWNWKLSYYHKHNFGKLMRKWKICHSLSALNNGCLRTCRKAGKIFPCALLPDLNDPNKSQRRLSNARNVSGKPNIKIFSYRIWFSY